MSIEIVSLAERPELIDAAGHLTRLWPEFMLHDPIADLYYSRLEVYGSHALLGVDGDEVIARAFAVPFAMGSDIGRPALPTAGWDGVIRWAWLDGLLARHPTHMSALEIVIAPAYRGGGLAERLIAAMKASAHHLHIAAFVAPVRPSRKHEEPLTPMGEYATRTRDDGLPVDPWLRVHVRVGARIHGVCPSSMTIPGSLDQWRRWSGLPLEESGTVVVPGALAPLHVDVDQDHAVYVEPNVWVVHEP